MDQKADRNPVQAAVTTLDIVEKIGERGALGVTELANIVDLPKSTVYNYLATLLRNGYLVKEDGKYRLSARFLRFSNHVRGHETIYRVTKPEAEQIAEQTGEIVVLVIEERGRGIVIHVERGTQAIEFDIHPGMSVPLHSTAAGKGILAYLPEDQLERIVEEKGLVRMTENTITDPDALRQELVAIRKGGVAYNLEEDNVGINAVSVPLKHESGDVLGSLSVIGPKSRMQGDRLDEISELLLNSANVIEINVRYSSSSPTY